MRRLLLIPILLFSLAVGAQGNNDWPGNSNNNDDYPGNSGSNGNNSGNNGNGEDNGWGNNEDLPAASIDQWLLILGVGGLCYVAYKFKNDGNFFA